MNNKEPYISAVITCRNDDYQGAFTKRFQMAFNSLITQAKEYNLRLELIIVEWNPPEGRPLLKDVLSIPKELGPVTVRFIVVPHAVHERYHASKNINIIFAPAINVGIRRARGQFIFSTTADIMFADEFIKFLAAETLDEQFFYRVDRLDVDRTALQHAERHEDLQEFCKNHVIATYSREEYYPVLWMRKYPLLHSSHGDVTLFSKKQWYEIHGWPDLNNLGLCADRLLCYIAYMAGLKEKALKPPLCIYHVDHDSRWKKYGEHKSKAIKSVKSILYKPLAEGTFLKMFLRSTARNLYRLMYRFSNIENDIERRDLDIRYLDLEHEDILYDMLKKRRSYVYNDDTWGLPDDTFEEFVFS